RLRLGLADSRLRPGRQKLASLKQFTMCDCSHRIVQYAQLQWATTSALAQPRGRAAIRAWSSLSRIEHWRDSARTVSSVSAKEENSIWGMAASCCTCRKVPEAPESTPRLRQRPAPVSQR